MKSPCEPVSAWPLAACLLGCVVLYSGCATVETAPMGRRHTTTASRMPEIGTTAVLPPDITVNSLGAGGVAERRDDWTEMARTHARNTLESLRPEKIVYVRDLELREDLAEEIAEVQELFRIIDLNLLMSYGPAQIVPPASLGTFDYSVGNIDRILDAAGADALLVVRGVDDIFAADRKALVAVAVIASAFTGAYVGPSSGEAHISAALIGRDGTILWYDWVGDGAISDLRTPEGVRVTIERLLRTMPGNEPPLKSKQRPS
jgi:hypothetical protein